VRKIGGARPRTACLVGSHLDSGGVTTWRQFVESVDQEIYGGYEEEARERPPWS